MNRPHQLEMGDTYEMPECLKMAFPNAPETAELIMLHWDDEDECYWIQLKPGLRDEARRRTQQILEDLNFYESNSQN